MLMHGEVVLSHPQAFSQVQSHGLGQPVSSVPAWTSNPPAPGGSAAEGCQMPRCANLAVGWLLMVQGKGWGMLPISVAGCVDSERCRSGCGGEGVLGNGQQDERGTVTAVMPLGM